MVYVRKKRRMSKRRLRIKRRRLLSFKKTPRFGRTGYFKITRWSSKNFNVNCHVEVVGNDLAPTTDGSTTFSLVDVNGSNELVQLFDNYRIIRVLYRWVMVRQPDQIIGGTKGVYPRVVWTHDFNDSVPITRTLIYQRANIREAYLTDDRPVTRWYSLKPSSLVQMYESATSTAYQPKWSQWLDTSDSTAPHYGIKYCVADNYNGQYVRLEAKLVFECKGIS